MCKCKGIMGIVVGLLLLLNAFVWPQWNTLTGWMAWIAILITLFGVVKTFMPVCKDCQSEGCTCEGCSCTTGSKPAKKKKK
jgi:hypothetical protein